MEEVVGATQADELLHVEVGAAHCDELVVGATHSEELLEGAGEPPPVHQFT